MDRHPANRQGHCTGHNFIAYKQVHTWMAWSTHEDTLHHTFWYDYHLYCSTVMPHNCTDWSTVPPTRKSPLLIVIHGNCRLYATVPKSFQDLEELAWKKFGLEPTEIEFYSSCMNLCDNLPARIDDDVWEHVTPYIGCIMVTRRLVPSSYVAVSVSTSDITATSDVMADDDSSDVANEFTIVQSTSNTLDGQTHSSQGSQDFLQVETLRPEGPSDMLDIDGQESHVITADVIPAELFTDVTPLQKSSNRWVAPSTNCCASVNMESYIPRRAKCRFTGLLNKLTRKNIWFTCHRMIDWITKCDRMVQGQVLKMATRLIFDRAVDEPERIGIYTSLCEMMAMGIDTYRHSQAFRKGVTGSEASGYNIISSCLREYWQGAFQQGHLSWGSPVRGSLTTCEGTMEEYYEAEKAKRRGIGLAGLMVELIKSRLFELQGIYVSGESFFKELGHRLQNNPNEGDIVSIAMLVQSVDSQCFHPTEEELARCHVCYQDCCCRMGWSCIAKSLLAFTNYRGCGINGRLRCRLQNLVELCEGRSLPNRHCIIYDILRNESRYSTPDASRWYAAQITRSTTSQLGDEYFSLVDCNDHWWFVRSLVTRALWNSDIVRPMGTFIMNALQKGLCSPEALEEGLIAVASDLNIAAKMGCEAYQLMATILKGVGYDSEEKVVRIASQVKDSRKLIQYTLW